jgi:hypothetical protein
LFLSLALTPVRAFTLFITANNLRIPMLNESVALEPFQSADVTPNHPQRGGQCPHHMPTHLKEAQKALQRGQQPVVYTYNNGKPWYMFEACPPNEQWRRPGDGSYIGSTLRMIKEEYHCESDIDCIRFVLARENIPLILDTITDQNKPIALRLLHESDFS